LALFDPEVRLLAVGDIPKLAELGAVEIVLEIDLGFRSGRR
jgi:hypothetical protein